MRRAKNSQQLCLCLDFTAAPAPAVVASAYTSPGPGRSGGDLSPTGIGDRTWRLVAGGDRAARARVTDKFLPRIHALASRYSRLAGHIGHDDIKQAAAIGLVEALDTYRPSTGVPFWPFAKRIALRRIVDALRGRNRSVQAYSLEEPYVAHADGQVNSAVHDVVAPDDTVEDASRRQDAERLHIAMGSLSVTEREVVADHFLRGVPMAAIAQRLGLRRTITYKIRDQAFAKLRPQLERTL